MLFQGGKLLNQSINQVPIWWKPVPTGRANPPQSAFYACTLSPCRLLRPSQVPVIDLRWEEKQAIGALQGACVTSGFFIGSWPASFPPP